MVVNTKMNIIMLVPCFNEEKRINKEYWRRNLNPQNCDWLFIDDGSTDKTHEVLKSLGNIEILSLSKNYGKAEAIRKGLEYVLSKKEFVDHSIGYMDSDDAFLTEDIYKIFNIFKNLSLSYDTLWVSRVALSGRQIIRNYNRHVISRIIITVLGLFYKNLPYDTQAGFKIFRAGILNQEMVKKSFSTRWFVDLELLIRYEKFSQTKLKIWEEPISYWRDIPGTKIKGKEVFRVILDLILIGIILRQARINKWT
jgi:glycosyltransferase involved in cell wall biosynthesis